MRLESNGLPTPKWSGKLNTTRFDGDKLRHVLIGMVIDANVIAAIAPHWPAHGGLFGTPYADLIGSWCIEHYRKHNTAPGRAIEDIFIDWAAGSRNDDVVEAVEKLLGALNDQYDADEPRQTSHVVIMAQEIIQTAQRRELNEEVKIAEAAGRYDEANQLLAAYQPIDLNPRAGIVLAADVQAREVTWLWEGWIPAGELAVIDGDPGTGKSQIAIDVAARITRGWLPPPYPRKPYARDGISPGNVLLLSSEDAADTVLRPRLDAVNADVYRIWLLGADSPRPSLPHDLPKLERQIVEHSVRLVIFDPFFGFLSEKIESNSDHRLRAVLAPLAAIAQRTGAAIVLIRHLNKKSDEPVLYRGGGSIAVMGQCRAALIVGRDPENPDVRVIAINKTSLGHAPQSLAFTIDSIPNDTGGTSRVGWIGEVDLEAADVVRRATRPPGRPSQMDAIVEFIQELLADGKQMPADELTEAVTGRFGCSEGTYKSARKLAGVEGKKEGFQGKWI
jgi:hypothetical protein